MIAGMVERGQVVQRATWPLVTVHTDAWRAYNRLPEMGRRPAMVCHGAGERARDDVGDGVREVHTARRRGTRGRQGAADRQA
ncbi:MAG TPA: hypothetical protein VKP69_01885 [Isosphaeraceae bacterium]|nr:hypothetical protein [Isosphaeraceae bacterium]